tara:strand:- start:34 stop:429 length:396 start_codon:yes stop_codon:yes gene_type:complete
VNIKIILIIVFSYRHASIKIKMRRIKMKILITILLALFLSSNASAGDLDIETIDEVRKKQDFEQGAFMEVIQTKCIDGYKFINKSFYVQTKSGRIEETTTRRSEFAYSPAVSTNIIQFMIEKDGRSVPAKC